MTKPIPQLLTEFSSRPHCQGSVTDKKKIELMVHYLWLRQLCPELPFETFLDKYEKVADYDADNLKHPADSIKKWLPAKSAATPPDVATYSKADVVELLTVYVDMIRAAEAVGKPIPMTLNAFLSSPKILEAFRAGAFASEEPAAKKAKGKQVMLAPVPTTPGERCILTEESQRQHRGTFVAADSATNLAHFQADSGELFTNVMLSALRKSNDPVRRSPIDSNGAALPTIAEEKLYIPKVDYERILQLQATRMMVGVVPENMPVYTYKKEFGPYVAIIEVVNSAPLYIDSRLVQASNENEVVYEVQPRDNLLGVYEYVTDSGVYTLRVVSPHAGVPQALPGFEQ